MFQKPYVIRDLNENRLVIRDQDPPFTTLYISLESLINVDFGKNINCRFLQFRKKNRKQPRK